MKFLYIMLVLFYILLFLPFTREEKDDDNPHRIDLESNPIDYIIILGIDEINSINNIMKYHDSYIFSKSFFFCSDKSNKKYLFIDNNLFSFTMVGKDNYSFSLEKRISSDKQYTGYIALEKCYKQEPFHDKQQNEIIIYGKKDKNIEFYFIFEGKNYFYVLGEIYENISCKLYLGINIVCIYSANYQVKLIIFGREPDRIVKKFSDVVSFFDYQFSDDVILYDTLDDKHKILCGRNKNSKNIKCITIAIDDILSNESYFQIAKPKESINLQSILSFVEGNCNYGKLKNGKNVYLICCGSNDIIKCEIRDMNFALDNYFDINLNGNIRNLTVNSTDNFPKLIFEIKDNGIYEYNIFHPNCKARNIVINTFQKATINTEDIMEGNSDNIYYISFTQIPSDYGILEVNDKTIGLDEQITLENNNNDISFTSDNYKVVKNFDIIYSIFIKEKYKTFSIIHLTIKSCYKSCKSCTESNENSSDDNHNCQTCQEKYYPLEGQESYCYDSNSIKNYNLGII